MVHRKTSLKPRVACKKYHSWRKKISIHLGFVSRALTKTPFVNFVFVVVFGSHFPDFCSWNGIFYKQLVASGNSAGISGDSGEMGEAGAPRTLPSTRAWGQDDGSSHKLPQIMFSRGQLASDRPHVLSWKEIWHRPFVPIRL